MSAFAALLLVAPLAALHPYKTASAAQATPRNVTVVVDAGAKKKSLIEDLPESFKISIMAVPSKTDTTALWGKNAFVKPLGALAAGTGMLNKKLQATAGELVTISGKTPTCDNFRFTGSGKPVQSQGRKGHFRRRKAGRLLQQLDKLKLVDKGNQRMIAVAMPYGNKHSR